MTELQKVQSQITEMIKSDYPNPVFEWRSSSILKFQFDELSFHGECMIEFNEEEGYYMYGGVGEWYGFDIETETIDEFMEDFKAVYVREQEELIKYTQL